jgi:hypothetical protein
MPKSDKNENSKKSTYKKFYKNYSLKKKSDTESIKLSKYKQVKQKNSKIAIDKEAKKDLDSIFWI